MTTRTKSAYTNDQELADLIHSLIVQHQLDLCGTATSWSTMLDQLHDAGIIARAAIDSQAHQVRICREHGASWADVGAALGVSRQAAQQRFGNGQPPTAPDFRGS